LDITKIWVLMMREYKHQTLNIKYRTPKASLTDTSVFDVGYSVLDIPAAVDHSYLSASLGLIQEALTEWRLTVTHAVISAITTEKMNTPALRVIL
jgi:hypothetical protein